MEIKHPSIPDPKNIQACLRALKEIAEIGIGQRGPKNSTGRYPNKWLTEENLEDLILNSKTIYNALSEAVDHNELSGLQGGAVDEFYHLTENEYAELSEWIDNVVLGNDGQTKVPQIVLEPRDAALNDEEGGMYYCGLDKSVYVCTDDS